MAPVNANPLWVAAVIPLGSGQAALKVFRANRAADLGNIRMSDNPLDHAEAVLLCHGFGPAESDSLAWQEIVRETYVAPVRQLWREGETS